MLVLCATRRDRLEARDADRSRRSSAASARSRARSSWNSAACSRRASASAASFEPMRVAGAGAVVDERRSGRALGEIVGDQPRHHVDRAARGRRHDDLDRPVRVGLRLRGRRGGEHERGALRQANLRITMPPSFIRCRIARLRHARQSILMPDDLDHLDPFRRFLGEQRREILRRSAERIAAELAQRDLHVLAT